MTNKASTAAQVAVAPSQAQAVPDDSSLRRLDASPGRSIASIVTGNTAAMLVAQGAGLVAGIGTNAIISRHLGPTGSATIVWFLRMSVLLELQYPC